MLRLLSSKAQGHKDFWKQSKPCHIGIHWRALAEYSQMSIHVPGFQYFFCCFASFCIAQISQQQHKGFVNYPVSCLESTLVSCFFLLFVTMTDHFLRHRSDSRSAEEVQRSALKTQEIIHHLISASKVWKLYLLIGYCCPWSNSDTIPRYKL